MFLMFGFERWIVGTIEQDPGGPLPGGLQRLMDGGKPEIGCHLDIVEPDYRQTVRYPKTVTSGGPDYAVGAKSGGK